MWKLWASDQDFDDETITVTTQLKIETERVVRGALKTDNSKQRLGVSEFLLRDLEAHREARLEAAVKEGRKTPELFFTDSPSS